MLGNKLGKASNGQGVSTSMRVALKCCAEQRAWPAVLVFCLLSAFQTLRRRGVRNRGL